VPIKIRLHMKSDDEKNKESITNEPLVYVPPGAKINVENINNEPPPTKYERHRWVLDINGVKKIVGGMYGRTTD